MAATHRCAWLLAAALLVAPATGSAQELAPLSAWDRQPETERDPAYPMVRCAGLYGGILMFLGEEAETSLDADAVARFEAASLALARSAMALRATQAGLPADSLEVADGVRTEAFVFAVLYEERLLANYLSTGTAIMGDPLITGDLQSCVPHARLALQQQGGEVR